MPRACDLDVMTRLRILLYSQAGGGKTTAFRSLPGKKFLLGFDPNILACLRPTDDIEYEIFIPNEINLSISTNKGVTNSPVNYKGSEIYLQYEKFMEDSIESNFFAQFDWVGIDSITSMQPLMLDQVANVHGREGKPAQVEDYNTMADALLKNFRQWTALPTNVLITAHEKGVQDKVFRDISHDIMVPGQYSKKICLLLSDIYHLYVERDANKKPEYFMDTAPSQDYPIGRCSLGFEPTEDVTIPKGVSDITEYGLGKLLREKGYDKKS